MACWSDVEWCFLSWFVRFPGFCIQMICNSVLWLSPGFLALWKHEVGFSVDSYLESPDEAPGDRGSDSRLSPWHRFCVFVVVALPLWTLVPSSARQTVFYKRTLKFFPVLQVKDCVMEVAGRRWGITTSHKGSMFIGTQAAKSSWISTKLFGGQYMRNTLLDFNDATSKSNISLFI